MLIDADWWSIRNRLMVGRIERVFPMVHDSIIPHLYKGAKFTSNALNRFGVIVLHGAGVAAVLLSALRLVERGAGSVVELILFYTLIGLMIFLGHRSIITYKDRVDEYYQLLTDEEVMHARDEARSSIVAEKAAEDKAALNLGWPARIGIALLWSAALIVLVDAENLNMVWLGLIGFLSIALAAVAVHLLVPFSDTRTAETPSESMLRRRPFLLLSIAFLALAITSGWRLVVENRWLPGDADRIDPGLAAIAATLNSMAEVGGGLVTTTDDLATSIAEGVKTYQARTRREVDEAAARRIVNEGVRPVLERLDPLKIEMGAIRSSAEDLAVYEAAARRIVNEGLKPVLEQLNRLEIELGAIRSTAEDRVDAEAWRADQLIEKLDVRSEQDVTSGSDVGVVEDLRVLFPFDSAELTVETQKSLNQLAIALQSPRLQNDRFRIAGHTDAVGPESYNLDLSRRRAAAVVAYLVETHGIPRQRLLGEGYGETRLFDPEDPAGAANRRVEVVNLEGSAN